MNIKKHHHNLITRLKDFIMKALNPGIYPELEASIHQITTKKKKAFVNFVRKKTGFATKTKIPCVTETAATPTNAVV